MCQFWTLALILRRGAYFVASSGLGDLKLRDAASFHTLAPLTILRDSAKTCAADATRKRRHGRIYGRPKAAR